MSKTTLLGLALLIGASGAFAQTTTGTTTTTTTTTQTTTQSDMATLAADETLRFELFGEQPTDTSQASDSLDFTVLGAGLADLDTTGARFVRVTTLRAGQRVGEAGVYRVIVTPSTGRIFIITDRGIYTLERFLSERGLTVGEDRRVTFTGVTGGAMPQGMALSAPMMQNLGSLQLQVLPAGATAPQMSNTSFYLMPLAGATNVFSNVSGNMVTLSYGSTSTIQNVVAYYDGLLRAQGFMPAPDASATNTSDREIRRRYTRDNNVSTVELTVTGDAATGYRVSLDLSSLVRTLGATMSTTASATPRGTAFTAPVSTNLGRLQVMVLPLGAAAPQTSANNFYLLPYTGATAPTTSVTGNTVFLGYNSSAALADILSYYDAQLRAQGFTAGTDAASRTVTDREARLVYNRGTNAVNLIVSGDPTSGYTVVADVDALVRALGQ